MSPEQSTISRRSLFGVATAGFATMLVGSGSTAEPDPLVVLCAKWRAAHAAVEAGHDPRIPENEALMDATIDARNGIGDAIVATPAASQRGALLKLELAEFMFREQGNLDQAQALVFSANADMARLGL